MLYLNSASDSQGNQSKSAEKAGYSTREIFDHPQVRAIIEQFEHDLLELKMNPGKFVAKAERNLDEFLDLPLKDPQKAKLKLTASRFALEKLAKDRYGSSDEAQHVNVNVIKFDGQTQVIGGTLSTPGEVRSRSAYGADFSQEEGT